MRWRGFSALVAVGAVVAAIGVGSAAAATTWTVDQTTGNDVLCPITHVCKTIGKAVFLAAPGDTVNVHRGLYNENVTIDKPLTLNGQTRASLVNNCNLTTLASPALDTIVNGGGGPFAFDVEANNVTIRGFVIRNATAGIVVDNFTFAGLFSGFTFEKNLFEATHDGVAETTNGSFPSLIQLNCFRQNTNAVYGGGGQTKNLRIVGNKSRNNPQFTFLIKSLTTDGLEISGNIANNDGVFLSLREATNYTIQGNIANSPTVTVQFENAAMFFGGGSNGTIASNILQKSTRRGIVFDRFLYGTAPSTNLTITGNIVQSAKGNGFEATAGSLKNSTITGNVANVTGVNGLLLTGGNTGNSFAGNIFQGKTWGCHVLGSSVALNNWNGSSNIGTPMNTPGTCFP